MNVSILDLLVAHNHRWHTFKMHQVGNNNETHFGKHSEALSKPIIFPQGRLALVALPHEKQRI